MNNRIKSILKGKLSQYETELRELTGSSVTLTATVLQSITNRVDVVADMAQVVSATLGIPLDKLTGKTRKREVCEARFIGYKLIKETDPTVSYEKIGLQFGGRDHSSVIHGMNMAEDLMEWDRSFREKYDRCRRHIKEVNLDQYEESEAAA